MVYACGQGYNAKGLCDNAGEHRHNTNGYYTSQLRQGDSMDMDMNKFASGEPELLLE